MKLINQIPSPVYHVLHGLKVDWRARSVLGAMDVQSMPFSDRLGVVSPSTDQTREFWLTSRNGLYL